MNILAKIVRNSLFQIILKRHTKNNVFTSYKLINHFISNKISAPQYLFKPIYTNVVFSISLLTWLGFKENEDAESELIMTLKRSVLCMQRKEFVKAEQMLHLALRIAQEQNNFDGITYTYDLMANLALERGQYDKSEKIFINVLQRLLNSGTSDEDLKVIHISLKLARIYQMKNELDKAEIGFQWCSDTIKKHLDKNDNNVQALNGIILDWYAGFLFNKGEHKKSLEYMQEAYKIYSGIEDLKSEKSVLLLNDLGTLNTQMGNYEIAYEQLSKALKIGENLDNFEKLGIIYTNIGLVHIKMGFLEEAKKCCKEGWRIGNKYNDKDTVEQANYCFKQMNF